MLWYDVLAAFAFPVSLIFGLLALTFPMILILRYKKMPEKKWLILFAGSLAACAVSLWVQIMATYYRVHVGDFSALEDFYYAVAFVASVLLAVTIFLNVLALYLHQKNRGK